MRYTKSITVDPGRLGLSVTIVSGSICGARIDAIRPACAFCDKVAIGDIIVDINGKRVRTKEDFSLEGVHGVKLLIVYGMTASSGGKTTPPPSTLSKKNKNQRSKTLLLMLYAQKTKDRKMLGMTLLQVHGRQKPRRE